MSVYRHDPYAASPVVSVRPGRSGSDASSHTVVSCSSPIGSLHRHDSYSSGGSSQAAAVGNAPAAAAAPHYRRVDSFGSAGSAALAAAASACCSPAAAAPAAPTMPSPVLPLASVSVHSFGSKVTDSDSDASGGASASGGHPHHHRRPSSPPVLPRARARAAAAAASPPPPSAAASSPPSEAAAGDAAEAEGVARTSAAGATGYIVDLVHRHGRHQRYRAAVSYAKGTYVIVAADRGVDLGKVAGCRLEGSRTGRIAGSVERVATAAEVDKCLGKLAQNDAVAAEKMRQLVAEYDVPIRIHSAEYQFDKKKLTFSYESDVEKPDWRPVLKAAFDTFRCRIWLSNRL
eukprot:Rhum_TRINITY_DN15502_c4_g1::Rhum_TRINITY_DN15502_c4_g1_i1::g.161045::m.161045